jgi:hypothetical protein
MAKFSRCFFSPSPDELPVGRICHPLPADPVTIRGSTSTQVNNNSKAWRDTFPRPEDGDEYLPGRGTFAKEAFGTSGAPPHISLFDLERGTERQQC